MFGLKNILLALLVGLAIGGAGGFYGGWKMATSDIASNQLEQVTEARKDDANAVADSQRKTEVVTSQIADNKSKSSTAQREARRHVERPIASTEEHSTTANEGEGVRLVSGDEHLGVGLGCVLNAARTNRAPDCPAPGSNEASGATPDATVADFIENDLEVVRMYHDLAARHAALVQFVLDRQAEQRGDMGILDEERQSRLNDIYR
jgi:hypothetical protein